MAVCSYSYSYSYPYIVVSLPRTLSLPLFTLLFV